ncbi:MAG: POT family MFS transporter [Sedimentisphaerales bacterium]|nr:POT family MFS transporter [Sedimentisphaerales bacterium]
MSKREYITAPLPSDKTPAGIPYILGNEAAERFAFYGMTSILVIFMTTHLQNADGAKALMGEERAKSIFHWFKAAAYFMPLIGAIVSDLWLGKFKTIFFFSIVYCLGFVAIVVDITRAGLAIGLILMAVGSGMIKPCVSANVGDQFGKKNKHLMSRWFGWFYWSVNLGACISMFFCPLLRAWYGPQVGFGVPMVLMFLATIVFWMGKWKFVHIKPAGSSLIKETFTGEGLKIILRLLPIYLFVGMFWSLFDQSQSAWVLQAENMELRWCWITWLPDQIQFVNSLLIMILIPLFAYLIYPAINKVFPLTPLRKVGIGMFVAALSFVTPAIIEAQIAAGAKPSIGWHFFAYIILTAAEVMVSITCLEFSYTQAPKKMKSFIMAIYLLSVTLGNAFTAAVNYIIENEDGTRKLPGASYYWFFVGAMFVTAVIFIPIAKRFHGHTFIQDEGPENNEA